MNFDTSPPAIEAVGLVKTFGQQRAVDGVSLTVPTGSVYGVLGPNGAGKTTTVRMLATLLRPDGGEARIFGRDVVRESTAVRSLVGVTGQYASVDEDLTATENLVIFSRLLGLGRADAKRKAAELLEEFALTEAASKPLKNFSGGMRRRLDLAASLIARPPLLFLDEPTTGLDPRTRAQMWDTIRRLVAEGSTVLLTTQYLDEADQLADRIAVIDRGKVIADGTSDELKASVGVSAVQLTLADRARTDEARDVISSMLGVQATITPESGRITAPLSDPSITADLLVRLRDLSIAVDEITVSKPSLDEVFLTITGHDTAESERSVA
ncbi:ABC-2 type transport system ATP-binding protein [Rhodococcus sp. LBL1]|uniref:ABC-2 type transport system ATP-binding protein n=1 Tax=Prescottella agglutinans TaxID=1644129 RepID=A0ABT6M507_9NOCA|nr:ATP-binding cassette domain-containing protein [Prescottella agglutinans]MDH6278990.1 ABC-2 type transport system ATP-binding protein [Prescottella agglutinans]MDH6680350.1 ABC-2 type transport system ATP-binding protein [Rhodococcus sp. LBL1]MDH6685779.1 ABC-2 type transport system ATP-binding protein [Rhodococcus sp. LBL2]